MFLYLRQIKSAVLLFGTAHKKGPFCLSNIAFISSSMNHCYNEENLFVGDRHAKMYAQFRPTYPDIVFETMIAFCKKQISFQNELAVDIGCGPGQSTQPLTKYFCKVIGVDISQQQISNAPTNVPGLSFRVSEAEKVPFIYSDSVDLVTVGQAIHWFHLGRFYSEVDRILKPGGSFIAYGYGIMKVHHKEVHDYIMHVYDNDLGKYWSAGRGHIENKYKLLSQPYDGWQRNDSLEIEKHWTIDQIVGYLASWSAVQVYKKENPDFDLIGKIQKKLRKICVQDLDVTKEETIKVTWPIFILMAHKPGNST